MRPQPRILPHGIPKRFQKLLVLASNLLGPVLLMHDLERADLLDRAVGRSAMRTMDDLAAERVDRFRGCLTLEVLEVGPSEAGEVGSSVVLGQHDVSARL